MTYDEWESTIPAAVRQDVIWRVQAYRLALYLSSCAEQDGGPMTHDGRFAQSACQLLRAAGSVAANIAEGYPRQSGRDRIRYYEYALGSAAEVKVWYLNTRTALPPGVVEDRFALLRSITRLLLTMIRSARAPKSASFRLTGNER
jgi:four helix bundle protein